MTLGKVQRASDEWGFNCGPGALCGVLQMLPEEIRPHMGDFEEKRYTNPTLMAQALRSLGVPFKRVFESPVEPFKSAIIWPKFGLVRVQWDGPWTAKDIPLRARYRTSHWIGYRSHLAIHAAGDVFDINAVEYGWISKVDWSMSLVPWLLRQCQPKASGRWWPTHCWEIDHAKDPNA